MVNSPLRLDLVHTAEYFSSSALCKSDWFRHWVKPRHLKESMRTKSFYPVDFSYYDLELMVSMYSDERMGCRKIAERFGCSKEQILKQLKKAGVLIRRTGDIPGKRGTVVQRFESFFIKTAPDQCWIWNGGKTLQGYGCFTVCHKESVLAHRFSWELTNGKIPDGKIIMHSCDNPSCVNSKHLSLETTQENIQDMVSKDRHKKTVLRGIFNGRSKLTEPQVQEIRSRYRSGEQPVNLIAEFPISKSQFWRIINNEHWL